MPTPAFLSRPLDVGMAMGVQDIIRSQETGQDAANRRMGKDLVQLGNSLHEGTIIDKESRPTVKTADFYDDGALLPMGGHKGYALALLTCLLGGLAGGFDAETNRMGSSFMQVLDIEAFTPLGEYQRNVRAFLDGMKSVPAADGFDEVLVPGDFEYRSRRERLVSGIPMPDSIFSQLREWASKLDVSLSEDGIEAADAGRYATTE